jgi:dipeptidyl aminopeptidase/acylaminoacyl peptidase
VVNGEPRGIVERVTDDLLHEPGQRPGDIRRRVAVAALAIAVAGGLGAWWAVRRGQTGEMGRPVPIAPKANGLISFLAGPSSTGPFGTSNIYVMRSDGTEIRRLTMEGRDLSPEWSPDGTRIAFIRSGGEFPPNDLYVMDADGGNLRQLTHTDQFQYGPSWSPDGSWLVVTRGGVTVSYDLWLVRSDGLDERLLTSGPRMDLGPLWSPDGKVILFSAWPSINDSSGTALFTIRADGTGLRELAPYDQDRALAWSPDGQHILLVRRDTILVVMAGDGSDPREVYGCSGSCRIQDAAWSPDGKELLVSVSSVDSDQQPSGGLVEMGPDGSNPHPLSTGDQSGCCASWQPVPAAT